jgi:spore germination protein GerM
MTDTKKEYEEQVIQRVQKMKKAELQQALLQVLFDGPDWQYERFIREYVALHDENN